MTLDLWGYSYMQELGLFPIPNFSIWSWFDLMELPDEEELGNKARVLIKSVRKMKISDKQNMIIVFFFLSQHLSFTIRQLLEGAVVGALYFTLLHFLWFIVRKSHN